MYTIKYFDEEEGKWKTEEVSGRLEQTNRVIKLIEQKKKRNDGHFREAKEFFNPNYKNNGM
jgi:hypothetical protein